jgi:hypothetical protein
MTIDNMSQSAAQKLECNKPHEKSYFASISSYNFQFVRRDVNLLVHGLGTIARVKRLIVCWMKQLMKIFFFVMQFGCKDILNNT